MSNRAAEINPLDDVIDSRDVIARIAFLTDLDDRDADETAELAALTKLADQCEGIVADWEYGETLIRDSYFVRYAQELAEECGDLDRNVRWPFTCIDWEWAARELQHDYMTVTYCDVTYWVRS